jgi:uncharacterized membrane protein YeiH
MAVIKAMSLVKAGRLSKYLQSCPRLGPQLIEVFDAVALAAFTVVGVVVVLDTSAQPLWLWGPIAAVLTASFGGLMRDLFRHDRVVANLRGGLYPEIAVVWGLALAIFLEWESERLQPDEIRLAVIVVIVGAFLTRIVAIARGTKGRRPRRSERAAIACGPLGMHADMASPASYREDTCGSLDSQTVARSRQTYGRAT